MIDDFEVDRFAPEAKPVVWEYAKGRVVRDALACAVQFGW